MQYENDQKSQLLVFLLGQRKTPYLYRMTKEIWNKTFLNHGLEFE